MIYTFPVTIDNYLDEFDNLAEAKMYAGKYGYTVIAELDDDRNLVGYIYL